MKQTMDNITNVSPEILWDNSNVKWTVKYENVYPEIIDIPTYNYGNWQNTLDAWLALRNMSNGWKMKIWNFTITATWNISITWIWFKPNRVLFNAWDNSWNSSYVSIWAMNSNWEQYAMNFQTSACDNTRCIHLWNKCWAKYVSMDSDWFTINCDFFANTAYVTYECFW
jgi:hypothetical protein